MNTQEQHIQDLITEQAAAWYVEHREGALKPVRQKAFMRWLRGSPLHVAEYLAIAGLAQDLGEAARQHKTSRQQLLEEVGVMDRVVPIDAAARESAFDLVSPHDHRASIRAKHRAASSRAKPRALVRWAQLAVLVLVATAMMLGLRWVVSRPQVQTFATSHGEQRSLQLPDNTVVRLNSDSSIVVSFSENSRRVEITRGQAYFEVAKDPARPFGVRVGRLLIKDIGTAFDVYRQDTGMTVTVTEGRVQVWPASVASRHSGWLDTYRQSPPVLHGHPLLDLVAGHQARISNSGVIQSQGLVDVEQATAWLQGNIVFQDTSIADVAAQFNRYNNSQISVNDRRIGALTISGTFAAHDVSTFVAFLDSMPGVHTRVSGRRIIVTGHGGRKHRD